MCLMLLNTIHPSPSASPKKKSVEAHPTSPKEPSNTQKSSDTATQTSIPKPSVDPVAPALAKRYSKLTARKFVHPIPPTTK